MTTYLTPYLDKGRSGSGSRSQNNFGFFKRDQKFFAEGNGFQGSGHNSEALVLGAIGSHQMVAVVNRDRVGPKNKVALKRLVHNFFCVFV